MVKVTIDIPENYLKCIARFASISRTLDNARYVAEQALDLEEESPYSNEMLKDRVQTLIDDFNTVQLAIDYLHKSVQQELWKLDV